MNVCDQNEFLIRCLNAAANLYGVLTCDEFMDFYNGYVRAGGKRADELADVQTLVKIIDEAQAAFVEDEEAGNILDDVWFGHWKDPKTGVDYIVYRDLLEDADPDGRIPRVRKNWEVSTLRVLTEKELLEYEDPSFGEECPEIDALTEILGASAEDREMAEMDAFGAQAQMRVNGASIAEGLRSIGWAGDSRPSNKDEYEKLVAALSKLESVTRTWNYRGHTQRELVKAGLLPKRGEEQIPTFETWLAETGESDDDSWTDNDYDNDDEVVADIPGATVRRISDSFEDLMDDNLDDLPPARYTGPIDFKFVKDEERRKKVLEDYQRVRKHTQMFVRTFVMAEMTREECQAAFRRLGFDKTPPKNDTFGWTDANRDIVAGDFGSMMDDQNGDPAIRRLLTQGIMDDRTKKIASYFENYRYTWLEVQAAKAGVGLKCRDLLTGEDLFLMETSVSQSPNVKGTTICAGIAPMGEVYLSFGVIQPANFDNPSTILKIVLTHLKLPTELPIRLSFSDQAAFAAETIRRLDANGKFATIHY